MPRIINRISVIAIATLAFGLLNSVETEVQAADGQYVQCQSPQCITCRPRTYGNPDLFYNYYAPATCGGVSAQMYIAPRPVPPVVGHTYITYQPFMPHEFLYKHQRSYYRYYDGGRGMTRTSVRWH